MTQRINCENCAIERFCAEFNVLHTECTNFIDIHDVFACGRCAYYEGTGCAPGTGLCVEFEIDVNKDEVICNHFEEV